MRRFFIQGSMLNVSTTIWQNNFESIPKRSQSYAVIMKNKKTCMVIQT